VKIIVYVTNVMRILKILRKKAVQQKISENNQIVADILVSLKNSS